MNPDSTRKAIRRSILKQEGVKRIEVVLDPFSLANLEDIKAACGFTTREAIDHALGVAALDMFGKMSAPRGQDTY